MVWRQTCVADRPPNGVSIGLPTFKLMQAIDEGGNVDSTAYSALADGSTTLPSHRLRAM